MRYITALAALILAFVASGATAAPERNIYVQNLSATSSASLARMLAAIQLATERDFYPIWHEHAKLVLLPAGVEPPAGEWSIRVEEYPDCIGCGGYHSTDAAGVPYAVVGASFGDTSVILSHELWEMLADPYVKDDASGARTIPIGRDKYIVETADPVEDDKFAYRRNGVLISDFVTPLWFQKSFRGWVVYGPYDFAGHCSRPLQILNGGYQLVIRKGKVISIDSTGTVS